MKNIAKILMVALLVIVATVSVSAAEVELNLTDASSVASGVYYLEPVVSDEHYANAFSVKFGINLNTFNPYFMDVSGEIGGKFPLNEDVDAAWLDYINECVVMGTNGKTGLSKKTYALQTVKTELVGDMLYLEVVTSPKDGQLKNFPTEGFKVFSFALYTTEDVTTLTEDDFVVENIKYQTWNGEDTNSDAYVSVNYGYGNTVGTTALDFTNNVIPAGDDEEEVVIENKETVVEEGCPVFSVNFSTIEADKYGFVGTVRNNEEGVDGDFTLADGDKVVYAEILSKDFEADKDARAWVKGVEAGATIAVRAYYVFGDDVVYGEIMEFTFEG